MGRFGVRFPVYRSKKVIFHGHKGSICSEHPQGHQHFHISYFIFKEDLLSNVSRRRVIAAAMGEGWMGAEIQCRAISRALIGCRGYCGRHCEIGLACCVR